jgi:alkylation response protein AidB-like acyl-CoA dehydrogenase
LEADLETMYRLNDQERHLVDRVSEISDSTIAKHAADVDANSRFPKEAVDSLAGGGFLGLTVSTDMGGLGSSLRASAAVLDQIAQRDASTAMVYLMHLCGVAAYNAAPDVCKGPLRESAEGRHLATLAWSESGSRSHFWAPVSKAQSNGNGKISLSAKKSWVTSAGFADGYVVTTGGELEGVDLYLVLRSDQGFTTSGSWDAMGMRGNASAPMTLDGCEVSSDRRMCVPGKGFDMMMGAVLPQFQIGNAAVAIGIAEGAVKATAGHLTGKRFEHLDSKLADLPNLRARLAQMRIETDKARAHLTAALDAVESGSPDAMLQVLAVKAAAAETAIHVTDLGMRACGGAAFSKHLGIERAFRDARAMSVMAPTTDVLHDFIGKALCGMELFA